MDARIVGAWHCSDLDDGADCLSKTTDLSNISQIYSEYTYTRISLLVLTTFWNKNKNVVDTICLTEIA